MHTDMPTVIQYIYICVCIHNINSIIMPIRTYVFVAYILSMREKIRAYSMYICIIIINTTPPATVVFNVLLDPSKLRVTLK